MVPQHMRAAVVGEQRMLAHGGEAGAGGGTRTVLKWAIAAPVPRVRAQQRAPGAPELKQRLGAVLLATPHLQQVTENETVLGELA